MVREADIDDVSGRRFQVASDTNNVNRFANIMHSSSKMLSKAVTHQKVVELNFDWVRRALKMNVHISCKYDWVNVRRHAKHLSAQRRSCGYGSCVIEHDD